MDHSIVVETFPAPIHGALARHAIAIRPGGFGARRLHDTRADDRATAAGYGQIRMGSAQSGEIWQFVQNDAAAHPSRLGVSLRPQAYCQHSLARFPRGEAPRVSTRTFPPGWSADGLIPGDGHEAAMSRILSDSRDATLMVQLGRAAERQGSRLISDCSPSPSCRCRVLSAAAAGHTPTGSAGCR